MLVLVYVMVLALVHAEDVLVAVLDHAVVVLLDVVVALAVVVLVLDAAILVILAVVQDAAFHVAKAALADVMDVLEDVL